VGFSSWIYAPGPGAYTSTQMKAKAPRWNWPPVPRKSPFMNRMSVFTNGSVRTSPVGVHGKSGLPRRIKYS
jgi:hypothetical protein